MARLAACAVLATPLMEERMIILSTIDRFVVEDAILYMDVQREGCPHQYVLEQKVGVV